MIGKHVPRPKGRSSFQNLNDYITGKTRQGEKIAYTGCLNLLSVDTATFEMESLAFTNKRCADPVMHLLLSWRENETPTMEQTDEAVRITLDELNLSHCQAVYALHQNTDNLHLHICVNRIDPETHRAVTPAGGWTRRAMEHSARRIEHLQGWQTEQNTWSTVNENGELVQKPQTTDVQIPQAVSDMENLTGEQSAIRRVQEALRDKKLSSWEDLHNNLALHGMKYQRKGSGAVIVVGDVTVKASSVSKNLTLGKLEKQLGPFQEIQHLAQRVYDAKSPSAHLQHKPLEHSNNNENWRAYIAEREKHYDAIKSLKTNQSTSLLRTQDILKARHRTERGDLLDKLRKSHPTRAFMNQQRAALATQHAYERAVFKAEQKKRREEQKRLTVKFPPFQQWLRDRGLSEEADQWRHRRDKSSLRLECPQMENVPIRESGPHGILGFTMRTARARTRFSREASPERAAFIDTGRVIRVYEHDDETLLAALQLSQQKWGGVQLNGSDEYKQRCAEIAAKNGIRVTNPELQVKQLSSEECYKLAWSEARRLLMEQSRGHDNVYLVTIPNFEGRAYSGTMLGVVGAANQRYAALATSENQALMFRLNETSAAEAQALKGQNVVMESGQGYLNMTLEADYNRNHRRGMRR